MTTDFTLIPYLRSAGVLTMSQMQRASRALTSAGGAALEPSRPYPLLLALVALVVLAGSFGVSGNSGALVMCTMSAGGLLIGRAVGFPDRSLVLLTLGSVVILWVIWTHPFDSETRNSLFAHCLTGVGLGLAFALRLRRLDGLGRRWVACLAWVLALGCAWEAGEWTADLLFDTSLTPSLGDSVRDLGFGVAGAAVGVLTASILVWRRDRARPVAGQMTQPPGQKA